MGSKPPLMPQAKNTAMSMNDAVSEAPSSSGTFRVPELSLIFKAKPSENRSFNFVDFS